MEHPLLEKYFLDELSSQELEQFQKLLKEDAAFKDAFEFEKSVQKIARQDRRDTLKRKLENYETQRTPEVRKQSKSRRFMAIAASVVLFAAAAWLYFGQSEVSHEDLFASNYDTYPNTVYNITRGDENYDSLEYKAFSLYESGNYDQAIIAFEALKGMKDPSYISFYMGQTELARGKEKEALALFKMNAKNGQLFKAESIWYQALIAIKTEQYIEGIAQLEALIEDGSYKKDESRELLATLQKLLSSKK